MLNWELITHILRAFMFDRKWIALVQGCLSSIKAPPQHPSTQSIIHRRDPHSPYPFILVAKGLSKNLKEMKGEGTLKEIKPTNDSEENSQLNFVDDTLLIELLQLRQKNY
jgi:hypothetical protein